MKIRLGDSFPPPLDSDVMGFPLITCNEACAWNLWWLSWYSGDTMRRCGVQKTESTRVPSKKHRHKVPTCDSQSRIWRPQVVRFDILTVMFSSKSQPTTQYIYKNSPTAQILISFVATFLPSLCSSSHLESERAAKVQVATIQIPKAVPPHWSLYYKLAIFNIYADVSKNKKTKMNHSTALPLLLMCKPKILNENNLQTSLVRLLPTWLSDMLHFAFNFTSAFLHVSWVALEGSWWWPYNHTWIFLSRGFKEAPFPEA